MKEASRIAKFFFSGTFSLIASLASIVGLILTAFFQNYSTIIALLAIIVFLVITLFRIFSITKKFVLQRSENGFYKFATYVRYSTSDGKHIVYELHKYLQCKSIIMDQHIHDFFWTGSHDPIIKSDLQEFKQFIRTPEGQYDKAIFKFKRAITYNDFAIVHIKMDLDDSDFKSEPYCEQSIKEPVQLISFRIELRHKTGNSDARVFKRKLNTELATAQELFCHVTFDTNSRSYEKIINNPEVGYAYSIIWDR